MNQNQAEWENSMPSEFKFELENVRSSVPAGESVKRFLLAADDVERTVIAMKRMSRFSTFGAVFGCIVVAVGTAFMIAFSQTSVLFASIVAAWLISTIGFSFTLIRGQRAKRLAGPMLMDCGRMKSNAFIFLGLMSAASFSVVFATCFEVQTVAWYYWIAGGAVLLPITSYFTAIARGHLQVHTNGIWHYIGFLPWHEIESWGWTGESDSTLIIQKSGRSPFFKRGSIPVPPENKDRFEEYLQQNCVLVASQN